MDSRLVNTWYPRLKELYYREPFRPFVIRKLDGDAVRVRRREWIMFHPRNRTIRVSTGRGEETLWIDADAVKEIELASGGNHDSRRPQNRIR